MRERLSIFDDPGLLESGEGEADEEEEALLTVRETALFLRVNASTVRRWIAEGTLAAVKLPGKGKHQVYRVKKSTIDEVLRPLPREADPPTERIRIYGKQSERTRRKYQGTNENDRDCFGSARRYHRPC